MNARTATAAAAVILVLAAVTGCSEDTDSGATDTPPAATEEATEEPAEEAPATEEEPAVDEPADAATLPDFVGEQLQAAQDGAQAEGFYALTSHDATGESRFQVLDRNWTVCSQEPAAGEHPTDTTVDFGAVKEGETCP